MSDTTTHMGAHRRSGGSALVLVVFLMALTAPLVCLLCETHAVHIRCTHNQLQRTTALYVAQAGVQDALAMLLADETWRDGFSDKPFPVGLGHAYTVSVADGEAGEILIKSAGTTARGYTQCVTVTVTGF